MHSKKIAHRTPKSTTGQITKRRHSIAAGLALACTAAPRRATVRPSAEHTKVEQIANSVLSPHDSGVLPCPDFPRPYRLGVMIVLGWVSRIRKVRGVTVCACSTTQPTRYSLNTGPSGFQQFKQELETMSASLGQIAPTPKAAPAIIPSTTTEREGFALLEAGNHAALASFYLRKGNVPAARRKAVQLLKSLQVLSVKD